MEIDRRELKFQARERMALTDPKFWVVALAYLAMTTGVSWVISLIPLPAGDASIIGSFFQLLLQLYTTVVGFGLCLWSLWTYRQLDPGLNSLMQGFSVAGRVVLMELGIFVRVLGWYFLIVMAMTIPFAAMILSQTYYLIGFAGTLLLATVLVVSLIALALRYAMAPYLLADRPDDGPTAPIYRSVALMRGWKMELFKLEFSFIGYDLINFLLSSLVLLALVGQAGLLNDVNILDPLWWTQVLSVIYSAPAVILSTLATVPINLRLIPYRSVARAGFYDARMMAASNGINRPEMPPL